MAIETGTRSRRALLTGALGAAAALAAQAIGRPLSARATDSGPVVLGDDNGSESTTAITDSASGVVLRLTSASTSATGLLAKTTSLTGIGRAVDGLSQSNNGLGVRGTAGQLDATTGSGIGVSGIGKGPRSIGVKGSADNATGPNFGVYGSSNSTEGTGVYGTGNVGVYGKAILGGQGVRGQATSGIGVYASASTGIALNAVGKVHFSRSGVVSVPGGALTQEIFLNGVTTSSLAFAALADPHAGRWVRAVKPFTGSILIYFNSPLTGSVKCNWFVLD